MNKILELIKGLLVIIVLLIMIFASYYAYTNYINVSANKEVLDSLLLQKKQIQQFEDSTMIRFNEIQFDVDEIKQVVNENNSKLDTIDAKLIIIYRTVKHKTNKSLLEQVMSILK